MLAKSELENLTLRFKNGQDSALSDIYDHFSGALFGIAKKIVNSQEVAEDVLQDSFIKIWKKRDTFDSEKATLFTWMLNITRNTAIDYYRKSKKSNLTSIQDFENGVYDSTGGVQNINTIGLQNLVSKLNADQQVMIEYLYFKGYTQQEVSDELDIPLGTVKTRSRSAVQELRKYFSLLLFWI